MSISIKQDVICARSVGPFGPPEEEKGVKHMFFLFLESCFSRAACNLFDVGNQPVTTHLASKSSIRFVPVLFGGGLRHALSRFCSTITTAISLALYSILLYLCHLCVVVRLRLDHLCVVLRLRLDRLAVLFLVAPNVPPSPFKPPAVMQPSTLFSCGVTVVCVSCSTCGRSGIILVVESRQTQLKAKQNRC